MCRPDLGGRFAKVARRPVLVPGQLANHLAHRVAANSTFSAVVRGEGAVNVPVGLPGAQKNSKQVRGPPGHLRHAGQSGAWWPCIHTRAGHVAISRQ